MIRSGIDDRAERLPAVRFEVEIDLPAGSRNHRFKAEPADDLLDIGVDAGGRCRERGHDDTPGPLKIAAVETP